MNIPGNRGRCISPFPQPPTWSSVSLAALATHARILVPASVAFTYLVTESSKGSRSRGPLKGLHSRASFSLRSWVKGRVSRKRGAASVHRVPFRWLSPFPLFSFHLRNPMNPPALKHLRLSPRARLPASHPLFPVSTGTGEYYYNLRPIVRRTARTGCIHPLHLMRPLHRPSFVAVAATYPLKGISLIRGGYFRKYLHEGPRGESGRGTDNPCAGKKLVGKEKASFCAA